MRLSETDSYPSFADDILDSDAIGLGWSCDGCAQPPAMAAQAARSGEIDTMTDYN